MPPSRNSSHSRNPRASHGRNTASSKREQARATSGGSSRAPRGRNPQASRSRSPQTSRSRGPRASHGRNAASSSRTKLRVVYVLVLFLLASVAIQAFIHFTTEEKEDQPFYNHAKFTRYEQFYFYTDGDTVIEKTGVDVSDHQGEIDWERVAKHNIKFAFIRAGYRGSTEGDLFEDACFASNLRGAQKAGIERGVYFFSQALDVDEAREEANYVLELLDGAKLEYPVAFDFEIAAMGITSRVADLSNEEANAIALAFCETIEAAGYKTILYGNGYDLARYSEETRERFGVWYAEYGALPAYTGEYEIWQYGSEGHIDGIETIVDLNLDLSGAKS